MYKIRQKNLYLENKGVNLQTKKFVLHVKLPQFYKWVDFQHNSKLMLIVVVVWHLHLENKGVYIQTENKLVLHVKPPQFYKWLYFPMIEIKGVCDTLKN